MDVGRLIGVVDLQDGVAVHAVQGRRHEYHPVAGFEYPSGEFVEIDGNPKILAQCYARVGLRSLYVADLSALRGDERQTSVIEQLTASQVWADPPLIDLGLTGEEDDATLTRLVNGFGGKNARLVIATESASSTEIVHRLRRLREDLPLVVSFDYRNGQWISESTREEDWLAACDHVSIDAAIVLDLASVGTDSIEAAESLCRRIGPYLRATPLITGGGVKDDDDAKRLMDCGVDQLLVASRFVR